MRELPAKKTSRRFKRVFFILSNLSRLSDLPVKSSRGKAMSVNSPKYENCTRERVVIDFRGNLSFRRICRGSLRSSYHREERQRLLICLFTLS